MRRRSFIAATPLVLLVACGKTEVAVNSNPTGEIYGPPTPPAATAGTAIPAEQLPKASGAFGEKPTITFPTSAPPPKLQRALLVEGTGPAVAPGDQLVANFLGIVWGSGTAFDNSYDRGKAGVFQLGTGTGAVIKGWDVGLVGLTTGTRVLLTLSPSDGYGASGNSGAGIKGTDTLVFVIDVVDTLGKKRFGQADAVVQPDPANSPIITGKPGTVPTLTIPAGLAEPAAVKLDVLAKGTGAAVVEGDVYLQIAAYDWKGAAQGATWDRSGPQKVPLSAKLTQLVGLIGVPVGSRVLLQVPADASSGSPASAFVVDIIYQ